MTELSHLDEARNWLSETKKQPVGSIHPTDLRMFFWLKAYDDALALAQKELTPEARGLCGRCGESMNNMGYGDHCCPDYRHLRGR